MKKSCSDHGNHDDDDHHQDNEDHDDAQPVAHEVEMKGKLMGQLHSHGHLIGKYHH